MVAHSPLHRSQRAPLTHWAPPMGHDAQALFGIGLERSDFPRPFIAGFPFPGSLCGPSRHRPGAGPPGSRTVFGCMHRVSDRAGGRRHSGMSWVATPSTLMTCTSYQLSRPSGHATQTYGALVPPHTGQFIDSQAVFSMAAFVR